MQRRRFVKSLGIVISTGSLAGCAEEHHHNEDIRSEAEKSFFKSVSVSGDQLVLVVNESLQLNDPYRYDGRIIADSLFLLTDNEVIDEANVVSVDNTYELSVSGKGAYTIIARGTGVASLEQGGVIDKKELALDVVVKEDSVERKELYPVQQSNY